MRLRMARVSLFSRKLEVNCIPSESCASRFAVIFIPRTTMAVVRKSKSRRATAVHWIISVMG